MQLTEIFRFKSSIPLWFFAFVPQKIVESLLIILLPLFIVQAVGGNVAQVGEVHALTALAGMGGSILWGNLSDSIGCRRPFLIVGLTGLALCTFAIGTAENVNTVLLFSPLAGFFMAAIVPVTSALVLDSFPESQWSQIFSRLYLINAWSFVAAVILGTTWLSWFSPGQGTASAMQSLLQIAGSFTLVSLFLCYLLIQDPPIARKKRQFSPHLMGSLSIAVVERRALFYASRMAYFILTPSGLSQLGKILNQPLILFYLGLAQFFIAANIVLVPFPIFLTEKLGVTNSQIFTLFLAKAVVEAFCYLPVGQWVRKHPGLLLTAEATALRMGMFTTFAVIAWKETSPNSFVMVGFVYLLVGMTWAIVNVSGTTAVACLSPQGSQGMAMGIYNAIIGLATVVGSLIGGALARSFSYSLCFATGALIAGIAAIWLWRLRAIVPAPKLAE
ncbi:MAG: MFS transporter [Chroococcales cyanobacterium]